MGAATGRITSGRYREGLGAATADEAVTGFAFTKNGDSKNIPSSIATVVRINRDFMLFLRFILWSKNG